MMRARADTRGIIHIADGKDSTYYFKCKGYMYHDNSYYIDSPGIVQGLPTCLWCLVGQTIKHR
jgi:hypothetical protein